MPSAVVQVRHSSHTVRTRASVLVINTGYLTTRLGILKILVLIFSLTAFILMMSDNTLMLWGANVRYFVLISFADWLAVAIMLIAALISATTAALLPKTTFDFLFHILMGVMILVGGILVALWAFDRSYEVKRAQAASILAIVCGVFQLIHAFYSYRCSTTN